MLFFNAMHKNEVGDKLSFRFSPSCIHKHSRQKEQLECNHVIVVNYKHFL